MRRARYSYRILMKIKFSREFFENLQIQDFMKIRPVGAKLFHAEGHTEAHDGTNSRLKQLRERA